MQEEGTENTRGAPQYVCDWNASKILHSWIHSLGRMWQNQKNTENGTHPRLNKLALFIYKMWL